MAGLEKKGYISCQGESGSCAFGASRTHYFNYTAAPQPSFEEVIRRVAEKDAEMGILPVQNSRSGLIAEPLSLLAKSDLYVVAEHHQRIKHHLMVPKIWVEAVAGKDVLHALETKSVPETTRDQFVRALLAQITTVYSDEQGLKQCDRGLKIKLAGADKHLTTCTAKAARMIAHESDIAKLKDREIPGLAAIASEDCAMMYKNLMLVPELNDDANNATRYLVVSRAEVSPKQMLAEIDVKAVLSAFAGENGKEDLKIVFAALDKLSAQYDAVVRDFSLGGAAEEAGQERVAQAKILREFLGEADWPKIRAELEALPDGKRAALILKLQPLAAKIREHVLKSQAKDGDAGLQRLLRSKDYQSRQRSLFIIRANDPKKTQADLLKPLVQPTRKGESLVFRVVTELPRPIDGKAEGLGLVIEADGCLLGAEKRLKKKKGHASVFGGGGSHHAEVSELERALQQLAKIADIRVLGTFAKEPATLGAPTAKAAAAPAALPAPGRKDRALSHGGEGLSASAAGMVAGLLAMAAGAAGVYWYSTHVGF